MLSLRCCFLAVAATLAAVVKADYFIDPTTVPLSLREYWCQEEQSSCPLICNQFSPGTIDNSCEATTLQYGCVCSNGQQPNISQYSLTIPYFTCTTWGTQCVAACGSNSQCASDCRQNHPCGALNPLPPNSTTSSNMPATSTSTSTNMIFSNAPGQTSSSSSANGVRAPPIELNRVYGLGIVLAGIMAGFALML